MRRKIVLRVSVILLCCLMLFVQIDAQKQEAEAFVAIPVAALIVVGIGLIAAGVVFTSKDGVLAASRDFYNSASAQVKSEIDDITSGKTTMYATELAYALWLYATGKFTSAVSNPTQPVDIGQSPNVDIDANGHYFTDFLPIASDATKIYSDYRYSSQSQIDSQINALKNSGMIYFYAIICSSGISSGSGQTYIFGTTQPATFYVTGNGDSGSQLKLRWVSAIGRALFFSNATNITSPNTYLDNSYGVGSWTLAVTNLFYGGSDAPPATVTKTLGSDATVDTSKRSATTIQNTTVNNITNTTVENIVNQNADTLTGSGVASVPATDTLTTETGSATRGWLSSLLAGLLQPLLDLVKTIGSFFDGILYLIQTLIGLLALVLELVVALTTLIGSVFPFMINSLSAIVFSTDLPTDDGSFMFPIYHGDYSTYSWYNAYPVVCRAFKLVGDSLSNLNPAFASISTSIALFCVGFIWFRVGSHLMQRISGIQAQYGGGED